MLTVRRFKTEDLLKIRSMNSGMAEDLMSHGNLFPSSAVVAVDEAETFFGAAYILMTQSFRESEKREVPRAFIRGAFQAVHGTEQEIEASALLLESLKEFTEKLQQEFPKRRIILQLFGDAGALSYQEYLMSYGFQPKALMTRMERDLSDLSDLPEHFSFRLIEGAAEDAPGFQKKMKHFLKKVYDFVNPFDDEMLALQKEEENEGPALSKLTFYSSLDHWDADAYRALSSEAFQGMPDSDEDIRFLLDHGAKVYFAEEQGVLQAAVMTYRIDPETAATENICCSLRYRRMGLTTALLSEALLRLSEAGYSRARLHNFSDNTPAFMLYQKLGYEITGNLIEYHFEVSPSIRDY